ncbi:MAG: isocitrate/isopropylmalate dehydrogenase family protein [Desulfurococcales archaeon]|nr:isocitrate/isopropylmalate dehydrogenase family protein [Desulfurococcales archaeon]
MPGRGRILLIPGDGVGPEVAEAALKVLGAVEGRYGLGLEVRRAEAGDSAARKYESPLPSHVKDLALRWADAVLKGPVGETAGEVVVPLRRMLGAYANVRLARSLAPSRCWGLVDLVIVRENLEDVYYGVEYMVGDMAFALKVSSRAGAARVATVAGMYASKRRGRVTIVHKANVLRLADGLFRREAGKVLSGMGVEYDEMYVDAAAMMLVRDPARFDVILTMNQYGDILSDLAAEVAGGIGLAPSANIGDGKALFEPVHGAAWDIAGRGVANPTAMILAVAMMLEWLGYTEAGYTVARAVEEAYRRGYTTPDVGGSMGTMEVATRIAGMVESHA